MLISSLNLTRSRFVSSILKSSSTISSTFSLRSFSSNNNDEVNFKPSIKLNKDNLRIDSNYLNLLDKTSLKENTAVTTSAPTTWIDSPLVPERLRQYLLLSRVDKPVGTLLLYWPCVWGVGIACNTPELVTQNLHLIGSFLLGSFVMRGAGCVINDMWDVEFDKKVERTQNRPLASGKVTFNEAFGVLGTQLSLGLAVLLSLPQSAIYAGLYSMPFVVSYPLMKRITNVPQAFLGVTFNWGVWVGYSAALGTISAMNILPFHAAGVLWTLVYDTIYGYQDRKDDLKIGVKSFAIHLGDKPQKTFQLLTAGMYSSLLLGGYINDLSLPYYLGATASAGHLLWQINTMDIDNPKNLWERFSSNTKVGALIAASIFAGQLF